MSKQPNWYVVDKSGAMTLCVDERDAKATLLECERLYPHLSPYFVTLLDPVSDYRRGFDDGFRAGEAALRMRIVKALAFDSTGNPNDFDFDEARADVIGRNGNDGEHYR